MIRIPDLPETDAPMAMATIAAVERDTGIAQDTLRVWERRYGFPQPERNANGERIYPVEQVEKLKLLRRLIDQGHRPGQIVATAYADLRALLDGETQETGMLPADQGLLDLVRNHDANALAMGLQQVLLRQGLQRFVTDTVAPLTHAVGEAWHRSEIEVADEHLYTEQIQNVLRSAIGGVRIYGSAAVSVNRPRVLLTTFPGELHSVGLLMVEAMLVPEGASCISLGTATPLSDIVHAANMGRADIVVLSFSSAYAYRQAADGLRELREMLPATVAIWAGGAAISSKRKRFQGVRIVKDLPGVLQALAEWRVASATD